MSFPLKNRNSLFSRRTLNAEPLEDRLLLTASAWGGFDPVPDINVYDVESSLIDIDFGGDTDFDQVAAADMNGDGINDVVTLGGSEAAPVISVYLGTGGGAYAPARTFELPAAAGGGATGLLADVTGDGVLEYVAASQNMSGGTSLDISVYRYGSGGWTSAGTSAISLSVYGNYSVYAVTSIRLAAVGSDLAVQLENSYAFDSSGGVHSIDGLAVAAGNGQGTFSAARLVPAFTGRAVGSLSIGGTDYLVSLNSEARAFGLWYYNSAKSAWSSAGSVGYAAELGNVAVTASAGSGSDLMLTGTLSGGTIVSHLALGIGEDGKVFLAGSQTYTLDNLYSAPVCLAAGDLNGDGYGDLLVSDPNRYTVLFGQADGSYTVTPTTVAQTDYLTTVLLNPDGDGRIEILAVGGIGVWKILLDAPDADPVSHGYFDVPVSAAVTGDFDGDGSIDIAVIESEGARVAVYCEQDGVYAKTLTVEAPTRTAGGATVTASAAGLAAGTFTQSAHGQILIRYTWETGDGDTFAVYDTVQGRTAATLDLLEGETAAAFAAGHITSALYDDLVAVVSNGGTVSAVQWGNGSGRLTRKTGIELGSDAELAVSAVSIADLDGRGRGDIAFLDGGAGAGARLGWLTSTSATFSRSGLGWGGRVAAEGVFSGLLLADITGDGAVDAVTTRTVAGGGAELSTIYLAEGGSGTAAPFGPLTAYPLGGQFASGIPFDGGSLAGPSLLACTDSITELGDLVLAKGRTAAAVYSLEGGTGDEAFLYLAHASSSALPTSILTDPTSLGPDYYTWVDEWSSFYVEIWGCANGSEINRFKTSLSFNTDCFTAVSAESGRGYTAQISVADGVCTVTGSAEIPAAPAAGRYALLARVLFTATPTGGVAIPDDGHFAPSNAGFTVADESINGSAGCSGSDASALTGLNVFSVRFDSNDDGSVDVADFTLFANNYGLGTASKPFKNPKAETFNVVQGGGLNVQDFTFFANTYGQTRAKVAADRFYDILGIDPNEWLAAPALLPAEAAASGRDAPPAGDTALILLAADDQEEYEWYDFDRS